MYLHTAALKHTKTTRRHHKPTQQCHHMDLFMYCNSLMKMDLENKDNFPLLWSPWNTFRQINLYTTHFCKWGQITLFIHCFKCFSHHINFIHVDWPRLCCGEFVLGNMASFYTPLVSADREAPRPRGMDRRNPSHQPRLCRTTLPPHLRDTTVPSVGSPWAPHLSEDGRVPRNRMIQRPPESAAPIAESCASAAKITGALHVQNMCFFNDAWAVTCRMTPCCCWCGSCGFDSVTCSHDQSWKTQQASADRVWQHCRPAGTGGSHLSMPHKSKKDKVERTLNIFFKR